MNEEVRNDIVRDAAQLSDPGLAHLNDSLLGKEEVDRFSSSLVFLSK